MVRNSAHLQMTGRAELSVTGGGEPQGLGSCTFLLCFAWVVANIASSFSEENAKSILYYFETKQ